MVDDNFFQSLKNSIENARSDQIEIGEQKRNIKRICVITDDFDDYEQRFKYGDEMAEKYGSEILKIFLYNIETLLKKQYSVDEFKESPQELVQAIKNHSTHIKELKETNVRIVLDSTARELLYALRDLRQNDSEENELSVTDATALTDFLLTNMDRERNISYTIGELLKEYKPQIIYFKPPLLRNRESISEEGFNYVTLQILKKKPNGTWVMMRGKKGVSDVKKVVFFLLGGQDLPTVLRGAHAAVSVLPDIENVNMQYVVLMDQKKVNMASLVSETNSNEDLRQLLSKKMEEVVGNVKIGGKIPETTVKFGEIESDLPSILEEMHPDLLFISPKVTTDNQFDQELLDVVLVAVQKNISVFVTY